MLASVVTFAHQFTLSELGEGLALSRSGKGPSTRLRNPLVAISSSTPFLPTHTRNSAATPFNRILTQKQGGGGIYRLPCQTNPSALFAKSVGDISSFLSGTCTLFRFCVSPHLPASSTACLLSPKKWRAPSAGPASSAPSTHRRSLRSHPSTLPIPDFPTAARVTDHGPIIRFSISIFHLLHHPLRDTEHGPRVTERSHWSPDAGHRPLATGRFFSRRSPLRTNSRSPRILQTAIHSTHEVISQ